MRKRQKKIKSAAELPDWFDLKKYSAASALDSRGWHHQISIRRDLYWGIQTTKPPYDDETDLSLETAMMISFDRNSRVFDQIKSQPIQIPSTPTPVTENEKILENERKRILFPDFREGVSPMTVGDLRRFERKISPGRKEYSRRWIDGGSEQFSQVTENYQHKRWMDFPLHESYSCRLANSEFEVSLNRGSFGLYAALVVNMNLPDSVLIKQFGDWLLAARGEKKRLPSVDFDSWVRYGVLPYIDLTIWCFLENKIISQDVMADAIYQQSDKSPVFYDAETLRKHTIKIAGRLLNYFSDGNEMSIVSSRPN